MSRIEMNVNISSTGMQFVQWNEEILPWLDAPPEYEDSSYVPYKAEAGVW